MLTDSAYAVPGCAVIVARLLGQFTAVEIEASVGIPDKGHLEKQVAGLDDIVPVLP